jgi:hypothetical protein
MEHERAADGSRLRPFGDNPPGMLVYTADGYMIAALSRPGRAPFAGSAMFATNEREAAEAFQSFVSYCARYEVVSADTVLHHVTISLFPNWVGTTQKRQYKLTGDQLVLSTEPFDVFGDRQTAHLTWVRGK